MADRPGPAPDRLLGRLARGLGSLRVRSTLVAVVVVSIALAAGAFALVAVLGTSLQEGVETTSQAQVNDVVSLLRLGRLPAQLPASRGDTYTQVIGPDGAVLASSSVLVRQRLSTLDPGEEGSVIQIPSLSGGRDDHDGSGGFDADDGPFLLLGRTVRVPATSVTVAGVPATSTSPIQVTVYVAGSLHATVQAKHTVGLALALGTPVLVALVGLLVWYFGGRSLRPVEAIRTEVADISGHDLHRRVPIPKVDDEVGRLARTMNRMLDRLESSADAQRRFVSDASHELRSPLAGLQTTLEVALAHPDDAAWHLAATDALEEAQRLHRLVEDLLELARADESTVQQPRAEPVDLDEIVMREARMLAEPGRFTLDLHRVSAGRVLGDPRQLTRVVHNLLDNARRHCSTTVAVELSGTGDEILLAVTDDGNGIPPASRDMVFERFARLDEARSQHEGGTGLGLAIVREIVVTHGGSVAVAPSAHGARLEVRFPAPGFDIP